MSQKFKQGAPFPTGDANIHVAGNVGSDGNVYPLEATRRSTVTHTQPSVATATSVELLAANTDRRYMLIQNNTAANIMINLEGGTLTGIAPTDTNEGIVLEAGQYFESSPAFCPTGAVTGYQTSGGTVRTISVVEGE